MNQNIILPFNAISHKDVPRVGGKGASLGEMSRARFPIPPGFCVTTAAFRRFMATVTAAPLYQLLTQIPAGDLAAARAAGETIRRTLRDAPIPDEIATVITEAWQALGETAVAVRSSATAEDLPEASFAGQQDTFLNVRDKAALLTAVRNCWISLFTDRAILYRQQNNFAHDEVALSVVVQQMIRPDVSGILFTADPISGHRHIASIDAGYGLGEALVAGLVEPDVLRVDKRTLRVIDVQVGSKKVAIRPSPGGGTAQVAIPNRQRRARALNDAQATLLTDLGSKIEAHYGAPQDIEWAIAGGKIHILQSRPITSLFPIPPESLRTDRIKIMFSFGAVQGMLDPMTPIGQDTIRGAFAGAAQLFGNRYTISTQNTVWSAAERLFINITPLFRHPIGRRATRFALDWIESGSAESLRSLWRDPAFQPERDWFNPATMRRVVTGFTPILRRLLWTLRHPDDGRRRAQTRLSQILNDYTKEMDAAATLKQQVAVADRMIHTAFPELIVQVLPIIAGGVASLNLLNQMAKRIPGMAQHGLTLTRGLPHNVTTQMDLALWRTAQTIRADPAAAALFANAAAAALAQQYLQEKLPPTAQTAVSRFLVQYGMRGLAEIDLGRPRWRENPTPVMQALQSYLQITAPAHAPDTVFAQGETAAATALAELIAAARRTPFGPVKAALIQAAAKRLRALAGLRESPKFYMVQLFGVVRAALLQSGAKLAQNGVLAQADDVMFLRLAELHALAAGEQRNWQALVSQRRAAYAREQQRQQIPRLLLSDGRAFYAGVSRHSQGVPDGALVGSPVSPGVVEGRAHVIFDPHQAQLAPGEILVCPGTDPAWTPLFLAAGGLVMEVGGLMTHGSVVAREYGIPAVVGVHNVTQRLKTGQRIRVDGSTGIVELLEE